jgi:hypothetical protein
MEVKPFMMLFDSRFKLQGVGGTATSVTGVDKEMIRLADNLGLPINGGYREYHTIDGYIAAKQQVINTWNYLKEQRSLVCLWTREGSTAERYGNAEMRAILRGDRDDAVRRLIRNHGGGEEHYAFLHEMPYGVGSDPTLCRMAVLHLLATAIKEAWRIGLTPDQLSIGGLLTGTGMDSLEWRWWDGAPRWMFASGFLTNFFDTYFPEGVDETLTSKVERMTRDPRARGITRHVLAETAKFGTTAEQTAFIDEGEELINAGLLLGIAFFHTANGEMSGKSPFSPDALKYLAYPMRRVNRPETV